MAQFNFFLFFLINPQLFKIEQNVIYLSYNYTISVKNIKVSIFYFPQNSKILFLTLPNPGHIFNLKLHRIKV